MKLLLFIIKHLFPKYELILKGLYQESQDEVAALKEEIERGKATNKKLRSILAKGISDNAYLLQELEAMKNEGNQEILPSRSVSFDKTVDNFNKLTSKAKTTLLFRIVQVLGNRELESLKNYVKQKEDHEEITN